MVHKTLFFINSVMLGEVTVKKTAAKAKIRQIFEAFSKSKNPLLFDTTEGTLIIPPTGSKSDFAFTNEFIVSTQNPESYNKGDVAEGIFAASIVARFINKNRPVTVSDVVFVISKLKKSAQQTIKFISKNENNDIIDTVIFSLALPEKGAAALKVPKVLQIERPFIEQSIKYANSKKVSDWASLVFKNNKQDIIKITGEGTLNQKGTKTDVRVEITDSLKNILPVDINVSLKAGNGAQRFGQVGGFSHEKMEMVWGQFGVKITKAQFNKFLEKPINEQGIAMYKIAIEQLNKKLKTDSGKLAVFEGIKYFATLHDENIRLIHLQKNDIKKYNFNKLKEFGMVENLKAVYEAGSSEMYGKNVEMPKVLIQNEKNEILFSVRLMRETKDDGYYFRNYIEKNHLMTKLIAD